MIQSINPYTNEEIATFELDSKETVELMLIEAGEAFTAWRKRDIKERCRYLETLAEVLEDRRDKLAQTITAEMGKPISESRSEVDKCAWVCRYYAENAPLQLQAETFDTDAANSYVRYDPLGIILGIMPWNYPLWQVFRFAVPTLAAGNTVLLKHAPNVWKCAGEIEAVFSAAGYPQGVFRHMKIEEDTVGEVLEHPDVCAVSLTGSKPAGAAVAAAAAKQVKKAVLELGGSNALVVFEDANLEETLETCVRARFQNTGQSCIAGKRLLLHESIAETFTDRICEAIGRLQTGDPSDPQTQIGVLAREDLAETLESQLKDSLARGANLLLGGKRSGTFFEPTVIDGVKPGMPAFDEETFGPLLAISIFSSDAEALSLISHSSFGLGVSLFTEDMERVRRLIPELNEGAVFVNELVKSDPRLPFGGVKESGFGRELSEFGIREFVNAKTVYIAP